MTRRRSNFAAAIRERRRAVRTYEASRDLLDYGRVADAFRAESVAARAYFFTRGIQCKN
jgi:hypothetical protein